MTSNISRAAFLEVWDDLPDLCERGTCDPFLVRDRLALYKTMIAQTGRAEITGADHEAHVFWGHGYQLFWQSRSGRLGADEARIDPAAWWGAMNISLSLIPYFGAVQAGCAKALSIVSPSEGAGGLLDFSGNPDPRWQSMIDAWANWFSYLTHEARPDDMDALRLRAWDAHLVSIEEGGALFADRFAQLPALEQDFALGWTRMVDFFGAAGRPTDLGALAGVDERPLAKHLLVDGAALTGLDANSIAGTRAIIALGQRAAEKFERQNRFWRRAMRRRAMREQAGDIMAAMFSPPMPRLMRLRLIWAAFRP